MAITRTSIPEMEYSKFIESPSRPGQAAVEVVGDLTISEGPFAPPSTTDYIGRSVLSNVETYVYKAGGASGTLLKTVVVTYVDSTLEELLTVEVS